MQNKKLLGIVGILVAIAAIILIVDKVGTKKPEKPQGFFATEAMAKVSSISLKGKDGKELNLVKNAQGTWTLQGPDQFPANAGKVVSFLEQLAGAKLIRKIDDNKSAWAELELEKLEKADTVTIKGDGDLSLELVAGKRRPSGGQYVRMGGKDTSWLMDPAISLDLNEDAWAYQTLLALEGDALKSIHFQGLTKDVTLSREKKEDPFHAEGLADKEKGKDAEIGRIKDAFKDVRYTTKALQTPAYQSALTHAKATVVTGFDGNTYTVKVVVVETPKAPDPSKKDHDTKAEIDRKYYLAIESSDPKFEYLKPLMSKWQFEVSEYVANNFRRDRSDFVETSKS